MTREQIEETAAYLGFSVAFSPIGDRYAECEECRNAFTCSRCEEDCRCQVPPFCARHKALAALYAFDERTSSAQGRAARRDYEAERSALVDALALAEDDGDHKSDEDCARFLPTDGFGECRRCGVGHGDPCNECDGRGFHKPDCTRIDACDECERSYGPGARCRCQ